MKKQIFKGCGYSMLLLIVGNAYGESLTVPLAQSLQQCVAVEQSAPRLACFDQLAAQLLQSSPAAIGNWRLQRRAAAFGEGETQSYYLPAQAPVRSKNQTVTPQLAVHCSSGGIAVEVHWNIYLGKNRTNVQSQFDGKSVLEQKWLIDDNKRSIRFKGDASSFVTRLLDHQILQAKIRPHNGGPIIATFAIGGLASISRSSNCWKQDSG